MAKLRVLHWNIAGSDAFNGYGKRNASRGPSVGRRARDLGFDVFLACEAGQSSLRNGVNRILGKPWSTKQKAIWINDSVSLLRPRKVYGAGFRYLRASKYGAAIFGLHEGKKFAVIEIHTDFRKPAKQAAQVKTIFAKFIKECDRQGIHRHNVMVVGDFNWDGSKGDNPFRALTTYGFVEHGNRHAATFMTGKHLDGVLAHAHATVSVSVRSRADLSDHMPIKATITLV